MATIMQPKVRPLTIDDYGGDSKTRTIGIALAIVGVAVAVGTLIANLSAAADASVRSNVLPWSFGLTTVAFAAVKTAIVVILWGILMKIWVRIDAIKAALKRLVDVDAAAPITEGAFDSSYGRGYVGNTEPSELAIHKMAKRMWAPMVAMGAMAVLIGFIISLAWAGDGSLVASSWTQGLQFLGEGMLLASISFLLGTILWAIRTGGSEVQASLGVAVKTLAMPATAKGFVGLMGLGLMTAFAQFVLYLILADGGVEVAVWQAWLGPLRELALALMLSGIALALVTIGNVLSFQFERISELISTGS